MGYYYTAEDVHFYAPLLEGVFLEEIKEIKEAFRSLGPLLSFKIDESSEVAFLDLIQSESSKDHGIQENLTAALGLIEAALGENGDQLELSFVLAGENPGDLSAYIWEPGDSKTPGEMKVYPASINFPGAPEKFQGWRL